MTTGYRSTILECPVCYDDMVFLEHISGNSFVKCKSLCDPILIHKHLAKLEPPEPKKKPLSELVSDQFFMDVISYARSIGKEISDADLKHELIIWKRTKATREANKNG